MMILSSKGRSYGNSIFPSSKHASRKSISVFELPQDAYYLDSIKIKENCTDKEHDFTQIEEYSDSKRIPSAYLSNDGSVSVSTKSGLPVNNTSKMYAVANQIQMVNKIRKSLIYYAANRSKRITTRLVTRGNTNAVNNSLRLNTGNINMFHLGVMMSIVQDPIQCGYLLNFSTIEHNSENLCFIMMVSRFRDAICRDDEAWPDSWEDIDSEYEVDDIDELVHKVTWPSKRLLKSNIQALVDSLWSTFLSDDAVTQICMSARVARNTEKRTRLFDLHGPDVFQEAIIDPIKTINKDILPRFLASQTHTDMATRIESLKVPLTISEVIVPPPTDNPLLRNSKDKFTAKRNFTLEELSSNLTLYNEFLEYLKTVIAVESLLCIRMIDIFLEEFVLQTTDSLKKATDCAWLIYRYFVAKNAPYEVSLHSTHKKEIMISLASVQIHMFNELKTSVMSTLHVKFNSYKCTDSYRGLWQLMKVQQSSKSLFFFSF